MDEDKIFITEDARDFENAAMLIKKHALKNEIILFKASHAVNLERVIEHLQRGENNREDNSIE